ncbi:MAG: transporter [Chromatiales bacterium]|nr:transporter [Chromatiales bacterium]
MVLGSTTAFGATSSDIDAEIESLRRAADELLHRVNELEKKRARQSLSKSQAQAAKTPAAPMDSSEPATVATKAAGPGTIAIDELAAERALERTLTAEGALLLGPKQFDVEPYFSYVRRESDQWALATESDLIGIRKGSARRNEFDLGVRVRAGLPFSSQFELDLPYRWVDQSVVLPVGLTGVNEASNQGSSVGDIKVGFATTLMRERGWRPDLIGRVTWDTDTGDQIDGVVPMGIGYNELRFGLTALKRQDPLAFTASLSYTTTFEKDNIKPGDELGLLLGVSLAASPETSLSLALVQSFKKELEINGNRIAGSDQVSSVLALGASSTFGRRTLFSVSLGVGLTEDAPDYSVNLSVPMRF